MTCQTVQNRILALPDPRQVTEVLREHLDACPACRAWWQQAARLERLLEQLPAPPAPADKKAALIDDLTAAGPVIKSIPAVVSRPSRVRLGALLTGARAKYAAGLAAAVLVAVGGWRLLSPPAKGPDTAKPRHQFLEKVVQRDLALARAKSLDQRFEVLDGLADDLSGEARALARVAGPDELNYLAQQYEKVVREAILKQADGIQPHAMTRTQKKALFDRLARKLAETKQEADRLAAESPPQSRPALKRIADTAEDGQAKLREILAREGT